MQNYSFAGKGLQRSSTDLINIKLFILERVGRTGSSYFCASLPFLLFLAMVMRWRAYNRTVLAQTHIYSIQIFSLT